MIFDFEVDDDADVAMVDCSSREGSMLPLEQALRSVELSIATEDSAQDVSPRTTATPIPWTEHKVELSEPPWNPSTTTNSEQSKEKVDGNHVVEDENKFMCTHHQVLLLPVKILPRMK